MATQNKAVLNQKRYFLHQAQKSNYYVVRFITHNLQVEKFEIQICKLTGLKIYDIVDARGRTKMHAI